MPKISVIVPIYNVAAYIEKCAISLLEQTLDDIEYLFVDDCSTDHSIDVLQQVVERYPERKAQVFIIRQPANSGSAAVRLRGVKEATGDYIIHCDSDDWVDKDYYEKLYNKAIDENADIVVADFIRESLHSSYVLETAVSNPPRRMVENMHNESFYCMLWNKLMRRYLLVDNNIFAVPGINMWEDVHVCIRSLYFANKISKVEGTYYHYWINPTSYTVNSANERSYSQRKACVAELEIFFADKEGNWSLLINYWKMLAKSYLLTPESSDLQRWCNEYPEALVDLDKMGAFSSIEKKKMYLAAQSPIKFSLYTLPEQILNIVKQIAKRVIR